jgi:hypothetical protein
MSTIQAAWHGVRFPIGPGDFSHPQNDQTGSEDTESPTKLASEFPSPGVKRQEHEFNRSTSYSAGVKNRWRYTFFFPTCLSGVKRDHFI